MVSLNRRLRQTTAHQRIAPDIIPFEWTNRTVSSSQDSRAVISAKKHFCALTGDRFRVQRGAVCVKCSRTSHVFSTLHTNRFNTLVVSCHVTSLSSLHDGWLCGWVSADQGRRVPAISIVQLTPVDWGWGGELSQLINPQCSWFSSRLGADQRPVSCDMRSRPGLV